MNAIIQVDRNKILILGNQYTDKLIVRHFFKYKVRLNTRNMLLIIPDLQPNVRGMHDIVHSL